MRFILWPSLIFRNTICLLSKIRFFFYKSFKFALMIRSDQSCILTLYRRKFLSILNTTVMEFKTVAIYSGTHKLLLSIGYKNQLGWIDHKVEYELVVQLKKTI